MTVNELKEICIVFTIFVFLNEKKKNHLNTHTRSWEITFADGGQTKKSIARKTSRETKQTASEAVGVAKELNADRRVRNEKRNF